MTYGPVRTLPHFLELELFDASFVWSNGCAFDADTIFYDRIGGVDGDLVVRLDTKLASRDFASGIQNVPCRDSPTPGRST